MDPESTLLAGPVPTIHPDALELAELLRPTWPTISAGLHAEGVPLCEENPDPPPDPTPPAPPAGDPPPDPDPQPDPPQDPPSNDPRVTKANREAQKYREELRQAQARLQEIEDRDKTEQQKALERAEAAEKRAADAEGSLLRARIASETGLPADLAGRLRGETEEDLRADATALAELVKPAEPADPPAPPAPGDGLPAVPRGANAPGEKNVSPEEAKRLAREDPAEFNRRWEAGEIPTSALGAA